MSSFQNPWRKSIAAQGLAIPIGITRPGALVEALKIRGCRLLLGGFKLGAGFHALLVPRLAILQTGVHGLPGGIAGRRGDGSNARKRSRSGEQPRDHYCHRKNAHDASPLFFAGDDRRALFIKTGQVAFGQAEQFQAGRADLGPFLGLAQAGVVLEQVLGELGNGDQAK